MRVEIWSDVVCPWCHIGKRRFETALAEFEHADAVEVLWRSFELDPSAASSATNGDYADRLAAKYGTSGDQAQQMLDSMTAAAAAEGLDFHFERAVPANTFDAHQVIHLAGGAEVDDQTGISGSATVREALDASEIDMYWEYTGTGWVNILGNTTTDIPADLYQAVADADADADAKNDVAWLEPAPFEDTYRIAVTSEFAGENDLATMSDAATLIEDNPDAGTVCAASEFINRDDGLPGLEEAYGFAFSEVVELDLNLIYTQVGDACNFAEVFSTDGRIPSNDLVVLEDDQDFFVEYRGALTLRQETLDEFPAIADIMTPISAALTDEVVTGLNAQVDVEGEQPEDVATEWLESEGLLG